MEKESYDVIEKRRKGWAVVEQSKRREQKTKMETRIGRDENCVIKLITFDEII